MSDERHAIDLESWHEEKTSAWLYGVASASETDPVIKQMFLDLGIDYCGNRGDFNLGAKRSTAG